MTPSSSASNPGRPSSRRRPTALLAGCLLLVAATPATLDDDFADLRALRDQLDVGEGRGVDTATDGRPLAAVRAAYAALRPRVAEALAAAHTADAPANPERLAMQAALAQSLPALAPDAAPAAVPDCAYDPSAVARQGLEILQARAYACYGRAAQTIAFDGETLDRLTVFARLAHTEDPAVRKRLFLALDPVWRTMNGDDASKSPYRALAPLTSAAWQSGGSPIDRNAAALGVDPERIEPWLLAILEAWRDATPPEPLEPWDWHYRAGALNRALGDRVPAERLRALHDSFYRSLGADPRVLPIRYDLEPRTGKTPVAYTTFGKRPRLEPSGRVVPGEAWIFATYRAGGVDNLVELLHETGHAVHILAIRTPPPYADWPDSDTFTEALADLVALEAYEPAWQQRWLGASGTLAESLRSKYASIVLDVAWALFELRMHRDPTADPNQVWSAITHDYLHVVAHPELSWWAMRGQLLDSPGYMMNYALGAIVVADLRARCRTLRGPFTDGDTTTYGWLSERLYRFGLEKSSRAVVEEFLGRPVDPRALLDDLRRMTPAPSPPAR